jgi:hypothetical protein
VFTPSGGLGANEIIVKQNVVQIFVGPWWGLLNSLTSYYDTWSGQPDATCWVADVHTCDFTPVVVARASRGVARDFYLPGNLLLGPPGPSARRAQLFRCSGPFGGSPRYLLARNSRKFRARVVGASGPSLLQDLKGLFSGFRNWVLPKFEGNQEPESTAILKNHRFERRGASFFPLHKQPSTPALKPKRTHRQPASFTAQVSYP